MEKLKIKVRSHLHSRGALSYILLFSQVETARMPLTKRVAFGTPTAQPPEV